MIQRLIDGYCRALRWLMVIALASMVVMVFGNVAMRYLFNSGITLSEELSRWLFVWMTFLGAVVALNDRGHLGTDALISRLSPTGQKVCLLLSLLLMGWICALVLDGALTQTRINAESTSAVMEVSMAWLYASGLVFALLAAPIILMQLLRLLTGRLADSELVGIRESEDQP